jgi:hypothetical protein
VNWRLWGMENLGWVDAPVGAKVHIVPAGTPFGEP